MSCDYNKLCSLACHVTIIHILHVMWLLDTCHVTIGYMSCDYLIHVMWLYCSLSLWRMYDCFYELLSCFFHCQYSGPSLTSRWPTTLCCCVLHCTLRTQWTQLHSVALREFYDTMCLDQELLTEPNCKKTNYVLTLRCYNFYSVCRIAIIYWFSESP